MRVGTKVSGWLLSPAPSLAHAWHITGPSTCLSSTQNNYYLEETITVLLATKIRAQISPFFMLLGFPGQVPQRPSDWLICSVSNLASLRAFPRPPFSVGHSDRHLMPMKVVSNQLFHNGLPGRVLFSFSTLCCLECQFYGICIFLIFRYRACFYWNLSQSRYMRGSKGQD